MIRSRLFPTLPTIIRRGTLYASLLLLSVGLMHTTTAHGENLTGSYTWKPLKIGGGGWVVGMDIHPTERGLMYVRTDVSGAYRWEPASQSWKQIVTAQSMPADTVAYGTYRGADSLVGAPDDPDIAYLAYEGEIYRSSDRGDTWTATNLAPHGVTMEPNGEGRQEGERLAVDPANNDIVYYGSITDGLWRTDNAGKSWTRVESIPAGAAPHGVNTVVFTPNSGTNKTGDGAKGTRLITVTVDRQGVFQSTDAGATWKNIAPSGPGTDASIREATLGPDGTYYLACDTTDGSVGSVWKYTPSKGWTDITPDGDEGGSQDYWAIAVDPGDADRLVVLRNGGEGFVSENQGKTWAHRGFALKSDSVQWLSKQESYWLSTGEIAFAPDGRLWFAEGFGVWWADDLDEPNIEWQAASEGIEETCGNDIIAPPGGAPVGAMWDIGVFRFPEPDAYTAQRATPYFMSAWALDWCASDPNFIAGVFRNHLGFQPHVNETGFSTDGGRSWKVFPAVANKQIPEGLEYGVIAVSANSPDKIVWAPATDQLPFYTSDRGKSWERSSFGGPKTTGFTTHTSPLKPLCADRVLGDTFYFYRYEDGVYRSTDAGATFSRVGNPVSQRYNSVLKATPDHAGHLWFAEGSQGSPVGGLWRSEDGGKTWTALPFIEQAFNFGFGKPLKNGGYPTLYVAGVADGETGIYRSTDEGRTWDQIGTYPLGIFDWIDAMDGDKDTFGRVYLAFTSAGFAYGEPVSPGKR